MSQFLNKSNIIFVLPILLCGKCDVLENNRGYSVSMYNKSNHSINVYFNDDENYKSIYPDTIITDFRNRLGQKILSTEKKTLISSSSSTLENMFEVSVPNDVLSLFIIHSDTLAKYPWETIRKNYNILKRYDLSIQDIQLLDFTVPYPPTPEMAEMRQYPPYDE